MTSTRRGLLIGGGALGVVALCVTLHGRGSGHDWAFDTLMLHYVLADAGGRGSSPPFAVASVDGGDATNWHRRTDGDDPPAMLTDELLPMLAARGLDTDPIGLWGWSLGGFGALLLASHLGPSAVAAVAASSPALWATWSATQPGTFDSEDDFRANDVFARTDELDGIPLRIDCGTDDPFAGQVRCLRLQLDPTPGGGLGPGCHDEAFWTRSAAAQPDFIGPHLA